jgi:hypothetical protein
MAKFVRLERHKFSQSSFTPINIPESIEVICEGGFSNCGSLQSVTSCGDSRLSRIEQAALASTGLKSIHFPSSIELIGQRCFWSSRLQSVTFDRDSTLSPFDKEPFTRSHVTSSRFPGSVEVIGESCFRLSMWTPNSVGLRQRQRQSLSGQWIEINCSPRIR